MHLSDYLLILKNKNRKPPIFSFKEQEKQQIEFFDQLKKTDVVGDNTKKCVDKPINNIISALPPDTSNNLNWNNVWPNNDLGWTGTHLSDHEAIHFEAIEALFRTSWAKKPKGWKIIDSRNLISFNSTAGFVMTIGPPEIPDMFVVKSPKKFDSNGNPKNDSEGEIRYEYTVGKIVCNQIRKKRLPNFPYYFGLIECSSVENINDLTKWCQLGTDTQLIMENVRNSQTFLHWFLQESLMNNVNVIAQVFNAILHAFVNFGFSHNDLHLANIMIRNAPFTWTIDLEEDLGSLSARAIAVIIDMGKSTFRYQDQFSSIPLMFDPVFASSVGYSRPVNDLIRFVVLIYHNIQLHQDRKIQVSHDIKNFKVVLSKIYQRFVQLLVDEKYFTQMHPNIDDYIVNGKLTWWNLPVEDPKNSFENEDFLKKLVKLCFQDIFGPVLRDQWNPLFCPLKSKLIENQFRSFLTSDTQKVNETPPKKRKVQDQEQEEPDHQDALDFLNEISFDTPSLFNNSPSPFV